MQLPRTYSAHTWLIGGRVQGVGFRPFACLLAKELGVHGSVCNRGGHVEIVAAAEASVAELFLRRLLADHPPIACPELLLSNSCAAPAALGFHILPSGAGAPGGIVLPDEPTCEDCLAELGHPSDRRSRYPFIACTQCGPRYTTTIKLPFDRAATGMAGFPLCDLCTAEYESPENRRFHAQVIACPDCGPRLSFCVGSAIVQGNEPALLGAVTLLRQGGIVAVKGIGGYHLLCDAADGAAITRLRLLKQRPTKSLAVMFPREGQDDLDQLRRHCLIDAEAARRLRSPERPIVLVSLRADCTLSPLLAPTLTELGVLMPYSPLHELLLGDIGRPLVATSGNRGGEPVLTDPEEATRQLTGIADGFLHHDRPILNPADDGIARVIAGKARALRLGRGRAPLCLSLATPIASPVLALGGHAKVTLALGFGTRMVMSPHLGTLNSPRSLDLLAATVATLQRLHGVRAETLVCDLHGGYAGTKWAMGGALPVLRIPHHHAHAAAIAGEFPAERRWLCFTWDGVGLGDDGALWGGEALLGAPGCWRRVATFRPFAPPGGERAAREPWRCAAALTWELGLDWHPPDVEWHLARAAWDKRLNCPATSAVGRLFDAAAALLGVAQYTSHEAAGPMAVEAIAGGASDINSSALRAGAALPLRSRTDGLWEADWAPLVPMLLDPGQTVSRRAATLHVCLAATLVAQAIAIRDIGGPFSVGLSGGVFQNRLLAELALDGLQKAGFRAYLPALVPCNDAGLSFGQVIEAAARQ